MQQANEHTHQVTLMQWFNLAYPKLANRLFAIPNGGHRNIKVAAKLKKEGVQRGVPDCFLPIPKKGFHGLFIELKAPKGRATTEQKDWVSFLTSQGYKADVCHGWEAARDLIASYLND